MAFPTPDNVPDIVTCKGPPFVVVILPEPKRSVPTNTIPADWLVFLAPLKEASPLLASRAIEPQVMLWKFRSPAETICKAPRRVASPILPETVKVPATRVSVKSCPPSIVVNEIAPPAEFITTAAPSVTGALKLIGALALEMLPFSVMSCVVREIPDGPVVIIAAKEEVPVPALWVMVAALISWDAVTFVAVGMERLASGCVLPTIPVKVMLLLPGSSVRERAITASLSSVLLKEIAPPVDEKVGEVVKVTCAGKLIAELVV